MLNGDAHHSKRRDGELRIGRCRVLKDQNAPENNRTARQNGSGVRVSGDKNILVAQIATYSKIRPVS
jgi:hypothetical protein